MSVVRHFADRSIESREVLRRGLRSAGLDVISVRRRAEVTVRRAAGDEACIPARDDSFRDFKVHECGIVIGKDLLVGRGRADGDGLPRFRNLPIGRRIMKAGIVATVRYARDGAVHRITGRIDIADVNRLDRVIFRAIRRIASDEDGIFIFIQADNLRRRRQSRIHFLNLQFDIIGRSIVVSFLRRADLPIESRQIRARRRILGNIIRRVDIRTRLIPEIPTGHKARIALCHRGHLESREHRAVIGDERILIGSIRLTAVGRRKLNRLIFFRDLIPNGRILRGIPFRHIRDGPRGSRGCTDGNGIGFTGHRARADCNGRSSGHARIGTQGNAVIDRRLRTVTDSDTGNSGRRRGRTDASRFTECERTICISRRIRAKSGRRRPGRIRGNPDRRGVAFDYGFRIHPDGHRRNC